MNGVHSRDVLGLLTIWWQVASGFQRRILMRCSYYPARLRPAGPIYIAEFADVPVCTSGETACDATDNAVSELRDYAERLRRAGSRLPPPSAFPRQPNEWSAHEPETYILVPLEALAPASEAHRRSMELSRSHAG